MTLIYDLFNFVERRNKLKMISEEKFDLAFKYIFSCVINMKHFQTCLDQNKVYMIICFDCQNSKICKLETLFMSCQ